MVVVDVGELVRLLIAVHRLVFLLSDMYRLLDPHLRQPVRPETEWRTAIRQTVPTKASVKAETPTIIK